jgi:CheY-like chemotaxis protein
MLVNYRFLVIDDSYIDRLVSGMLVRHTYNVTEVYEVNGGQQGLDWLLTEGLKSEAKLIVLLDIMMPQMNGFEFLERFDKLDKILQDKTTIVMLSSTLDHEDMQRAKKHPSVKKLLSKPLSANELRNFLV